MIKIRLLRGGHYPEFIRQTPCGQKGGRDKDVGERDVPVEADITVMWGHEPRNVQALWILEKGREWILPQGLQKKRHLANMVTLAQ